MRITALLFIMSICVLPGCQAQNTNRIAVAQDPYAPKLRIAVTNAFSGELDIAYRFSEEQLARMARTKLETNRFVAYLERRWPVERLRMYCVPTNRFPEGYQNLVAHNVPVETEVHKGKSTSFDRIWVYVGEDDGHNTYVGEAGTKWHRWKYSINVERGKSHWVILEQLPNDFMDASQYDPK